MLTKKSVPVTWREVSAAGVEVPKELVTLWSQLDDLEAERDALGPAPAVVSAPALVLQGASIAEAVDAEVNATRAAEVHAARQKATTEVVRLLGDRVVRHLTEHRDTLIEDHLRPVVADIIGQARSLVVTLEPFAPTFDPDEVAKWATPAHIKAWRTAAELQQRLDLCLAAWGSLWKHATSALAQGEGLPGYLRIDAPGGVHAWERPLEVTDVEVRDGRNTNVLAIALHSDAGYRLASGAEMVDISERFQLESSWVRGEHNPRQVFLPGEPVPEHHVAARKRKRVAFL